MVVENVSETIMSRFPLYEKLRRAFTVLSGGAPRSGQSAVFAGREAAGVADGADHLNNHFGVKGFEPHSFGS